MQFNTLAYMGPLISYEENEVLSGLMLVGKAKSLPKSAVHERLRLSVVMISVILSVKMLRVIIFSLVSLTPLKLKTLGLSVINLSVIMLVSLF